MAREHLKGSLMLALESTSSRMSNLARQEIYLGGPQSLEETLRGIQAVSAARVHRLCRQLLEGQRLGPDMAWMRQGAGCKREKNFQLLIRKRN